MVHGLNANERTNHLKQAILCPPTSLIQARRLPTVRAKLKKIRQDRQVVQHFHKSSERKAIVDVLPEPYLSFRFRHKFSLMVVGPSMSGKSCFVKVLLERDHIEYENHRKCRKIHWFYGQYQDMFKDMKRSLGQDIYFQEGLPTFQLDLSDIDPKYNNIIVLDDLMDLAVDSPIISKLFTQGRHRNASVILLLQNAFPKGKYNTSISRNAQYMALFRCPADRRQIGIMAERIFDKTKPLFMQIYNEITVKPYSYVLVDNKADTAVHRQIISDVFGSCVSFALPGTSKPQTLETRAAAQMKAEQDTVKNSATRILQVDERRGPLLVHLSQSQWSMVKDAFRDVESGGNPPAGWNIWRIYIIDTSNYFLPVLLKHSNLTKTVFYRVSKDWLLFTFPMFKPQLQSNTSLHGY